MRKLVLLVITLFIGFALIACVDTSQENTDDDPKADGPREKCTTEELAFPTEEADVESIVDYSDDERALLDVGDFTDETIVTFEDAFFEAAIRQRLFLEEGEPILFGALQDVKVLRLFSYNIKSIKGIELFQNIEELYLDGNLTLASVNGIQALIHLKHLSIERTSVKDIFYEVPNLVFIEADKTKIDLTPTELETLMILMPKLRRLHVRNTPFTLTHDHVELLNATRDLENDILGFNLRIDFTQIDFASVDYEELFLFDDEGNLEWYNTNASIDGLTSVFDGPGKYIDIRNPIEAEEIASSLSAIGDIIYEDKDMPRGAQMLLLYEHLIENIHISSEGSEYIVDAFKGEIVTEDVAYRAMVIAFMHYGFYAYIEDFFIQSYGQNNFEFHQNILYIEYQGQLFATIINQEDPYDYAFMGREKVIVHLNSLLTEHEFGIEPEPHVFGKLGEDFDRLYISRVLEKVLIIDDCYDIYTE